MVYVYVLMYDYVNVDSGDFMVDTIGVYQELEFAQKQMKKEIEEIKKDFEYCDYEQELGDNAYSIWETGEWVNHHCSLIIRRVQEQ